MRAVTRSSRLSRQSNYLRMFRIVLAITIAVFPAFGLAQLVIDPEKNDPMFVRVLFSISAAVLLAGTYRCEWVRIRISQLTSVFLILVSYWYVALAYAGGFSPESAVGLIVTFAAVGVGASFWLQSILSVSMYMLSMMLSIGFAVYSIDAPGIHPAVMMLACFGVGLVIFVALLSREKADEDMYAQHGLLRSLFDESDDAHILFDTQTGRIIDFNQAALALFEATEEQLTARRMDWKTRLRALDIDGPIDDRAMERRERKCKARSGRIFWADVSTHNLQIEDHEITLLKLFDVTEKREAARSTILEARRAAAVAELSAVLTTAGFEDSDPMQIVAQTVTRSQADVCIVCCISVLTNLVGNAIRFTDEGGIKVDVQQAGEELVISVEDTGIGIGKEFMPHLFTPFRQESSGFARSHEGTGLGLTITRRLVELMGGAIEVESRRGVGSAFRVRFPINGAVKRAVVKEPRSRAA